MKKKIIIFILVVLVVIASYLVYRWARFSQLPDGSPEIRPVENQ